MSPQSPWYIERKADKAALGHFRKGGITIALKGGTQLGKSSLANRLKAVMEQGGWRTVSVDVGGEFEEADFATGQAFLRRLAEKIIENIGISESTLEAFKPKGDPSNFRGFLDKLNKLDPQLRLLLTLDHIDELATKPCCSPVLSGLRLVHARQTELGDRSWLKMIHILTVTPRQTGELGSVFDVAKQLEISDFERSELQRLATLFGNPSVDITRLHEFLGGHPALCRMALNHIYDEEQSLDDLIAEARQMKGLFKQHVDKVLQRFRKSPDAKSLANALRLLINGTPLDSDDTFEALLALGVVTGTYYGDARLRCELYREWLPKRLPK